VVTPNHQREVASKDLKQANDKSLKQGKPFERTSKTPHACLTQDKTNLGTLFLCGACNVLVLHPNAVPDDNGLALFFSGSRHHEQEP
jgi:hypothetical protein